MTVDQVPWFLSVYVIFPAIDEAEDSIHCLLRPT